MQESLLTLSQLQQIDQQLHELEQLKIDIPRQLNLSNQSYTEAENRLLEREGILEELQKNRRQHERDVDASQEQIRKYQTKLHNVKTNKEYDALQHEIQAQKMKINECEDETLELMVKIEAVTEELENLRAEVKSHKERVTEECAALQLQSVTVDEDIEIKLDERKRKQMHIESRVLKLYDRIRQGRRRDAVVPVKKGACGGCFHIIPLQQVAEIRHMNRLVTCEMCGRILIMESDG